ncbi:hypothetical protein SCA6_017041 [Theobroma cacao]
MWQVSQAFDSPSRGHSDNIACYFLASVGSDSLSLRCYTGQMRSSNQLNFSYWPEVTKESSSGATISCKDILEL